MRRPSLPALAALLLELGCAAPPAPEVPSLAVDAGWVEVLEADRFGRYGLQLRFPGIGPERIVAPTLGVVVGADDSSEVFAGIARDFWLDRRWVLRPEWSMGIFSEGEVLDLGYELEFRSAILLEYRFANGNRLGLGYSHTSNADLGDSNPGTEALVFVLALPLEKGEPERRPEAR